MGKRIKEGLSYSTLLWLFMLGSVVGFIFEGLHAVVRRGAWENHSATVWGPFCIIYGIGAVAVYLVSLILMDRSIPEQFLMFTAAGSTVEYVCSFIQERVFGSRSWDYSARFMNINGRICLEMSLIWGILGLGFARLVFPFVLKAADAVHSHVSRFACIALTVFMAMNLLVSAAAVLRWRDRRNGLPPRNAAESYIDSKYGEEVMERIYGNMEFGEEE